MSERGKFEMWAKDFYQLDMDADPETGATDYLEGDTLAAWCGWQAAKAESAAELAALRADYENSCKLVADMWEAATGSKDGPKAGIAMWDKHLPTAIVLEVIRRDPLGHLSRSGL